MKTYKKLTTNDNIYENCFLEVSEKLPQKKNFTSLIVVTILLLFSILAMNVSNHLEIKNKESIALKVQDFNLFLMSEVTNNKDLEKVATNILINQLQYKYFGVPRVKLSDSNYLVFSYLSNDVSIIKDKIEDSNITKITIEITPENMVVLDKQIKSLKINNDNYQIIENQYNNKLNKFTFSFIDKENNIK